MEYDIADAHTDLITVLNKDQITSFVHTLPSNVKVLNCALFTTDNKLNINQITKYKRAISSLQQQTTTTLLFSIEDIGSIPFHDINNLIKLHPYCCSLSWNYQNNYAGGALSDGALTDLGINFIKNLEQHNIFIDTAHLNRKSFWQFANMTTKPILNTHCNIDSLFNHPRNLTDAQIQKIVDTNGFMGITIYEKFISSEKISDRDVAMQFDYLIKNFGYKNFGLGTDFFGINKNNLPQDINEYKSLSLIGKELELLGYSTEIINCILNKNFTSFLKNNRVCSTIN